MPNEASDGVVTLRMTVVPGVVVGSDAQPEYQGAILPVNLEQLPKGENE